MSNQHEEIEKFSECVKWFGREQYRLGQKDGLEVAKKILVWLNGRPPTKRQMKIRIWAATEIMNYERSITQ